MAEKDFVKLKNVTKIYQMGEVQIRAVDGIDFSIDKGEFVVAQRLKGFLWKSKILAGTLI